MARPLRTASGAVTDAPLVLFDLVTSGGVTGRSYIFAYDGAFLPALVSIADGIAEGLAGRVVAPARRMWELQDRFRLPGMQGLVGMVVSGIEMALWDALGHLTSQPVATLLGGEPVPLRAYDSYGMAEPGQELKDSVDAGFRGVKIKLGYPDARRDVEVVSRVREIIGPEVALMVDYNQSLTPQEARRRVDSLREFDLYWIEEPVHAEDLAGHAYVRRTTGAMIQTGENWWFPDGCRAAISAGASDFAMFDIMKIGGFTGWTLAAGQASAASLPVSSHLFVEASAHAMAVTPSAGWVEYLDLAGPVVREPCRPVDGHITPRGPGLGLTWDEDAIERLSP